MGFGFYIIALLSLICIVRAFGYHGTKRFIFRSIPVLAVCSFLSGAVHVYARAEDAGLPDAVKNNAARFLALPLWAAAAAATVCLAAVTVTLVQLKKTIGRELSAVSVCEGIDQLPDGICVSLQNGFPRLVNDKMQRISNTAFGEGVFDTKKLNAKADQRSFRPGCRVEERDGNRFLCLPDGTVWKLNRQPLQVDGLEMTEIIAYDVTERYNDLQELEQRNETVQQNPCPEHIPSDQIHAERNGK